MESIIELSDGVSDWVGRSEFFRMATLQINLAQLRDKNMSRILHYAMHLLEKIDDGSGVGYFLAMHIGHVAGVDPVVEGGSPFQPDHKLIKYRKGLHGLNRAFFQEGGWKCQNLVAEP
jgi:hypothetical protein